MAKKTEKNPKPLSLKEVQQALQQVEKQRASKDLSPEEREALEEAGVTLRCAERAAIQDLEKGLITDFEAQTKQVNLNAADIRKTVTRLNRLPKVLDTTETVVKECVRVLKLIASFSLIWLFLLGFGSCAVSQYQIGRINALALNGDSVSQVPSALMEKLAEVRLERGLMYAASLQGVDTRIDELNGISAQQRYDASLKVKADVYVNVLNSYLRALRSMASDTRWKQSGVELRGLGRNIDSLFMAYNTLKWSEPIPVGISKQAGKTGGYLTEQVLRQHQGRALRKVVQSGDSLVAACCEGLIQVLKGDGLEQLISNEESGLEANFRSYLSAMQVQGRLPDRDLDREYLHLKSELLASRQLRTQCSTALRSLQKAHHKVYLGLNAKAAKAANGGKRPKPTKAQRQADYNEAGEAIAQLAAQAKDLMKLLAK